MFKVDYTIKENISATNKKKLKIIIIPQNNADKNWIVSAIKFVYWFIIHLLWVPVTDFVKRFNEIAAY